MLRNDEATCGSTNPLAFRKLRESLMMMFVIQEKAYEQPGLPETGAIIAEIRAALAPCFAGKLGGPDGTLKCDASIRYFGGHHEEKISQAACGV